MVMRAWAEAESHPLVFIRRKHTAVGGHLRQSHMVVVGLSSRGFELFET